MYVVPFFSKNNLFADAKQKYNTGWPYIPIEKIVDGLSF